MECGSAYRHRIKMHPFTTRDRVAQRIRRLLLKQNARNAVADNFRGPAANKSDYRLAAGLRLGHHDSKIFFAREHQSSAALHGLAQHRRRLGSQETDITASLSLESTVLRPIADYQERLAAAVESLDGQIDALVGNKRGNNQEIFLLRSCRIRKEIFSVNRGIDYRAFPIIIATDPLCNIP